MAQLRDVKTGELVFEGTPLECVVHARELGGAAVSDQTPEAPAGVELMYDDVGLGFNPDAVLEEAERRVEGLKSVKAGDVPAGHPHIDDTRAEARANLEADRVDEVSAALEAARAAQDNAG